MARPPRVSVFDEPPPEEVTVAPPEYVKPEKPPRVSVFVEPPPETVTVAPPEYVKPEKPPRVSVFDPSTVSSFTPFGDLTLSQLVMDYYPLPEAAAEQEITLPSIYGGQYVPGVEPVPFTPMVVEYATSERDPIPITTDQVEPPIEPEEPYVFTQCLDVYRLSNGSVMATRETVGYETLADYVNVQKLLVRDCGRDVPSDQEVLDYYGYTTPTPNGNGNGNGNGEPTPTDERPVKWIPEPFFSFINEVFSK